MKGSSVEKKKNKRRASAPSKYVPSTKKNYGWLWGLLVIVVVAVIIGVGIHMGVKSKDDSADGADITLKNSVVNVSDDYIEFRSKDAKKDAKVVELFEDPRCPLCSELEKTYGKQMADAIESNQVILHVHLMDFLNQSGKTQYSTRANAALVTAALTGDAESAFRFHSILWHTAPAEGQDTVEPSDEDLADKAKRAGIKGDALDKIKSGQYDTMRASKMGNDNMKDLGKRLGKDSGTPAVFTDGKRIDTQKSYWVTSLYSEEKK